MRTLLSGILIAALTGSSLLAADPKDILKPKPFRAEEPLPMQRTQFVETEAPKAPRLTKGKIAWIAVGVGAVITGPVFASRGGNSSGPGTVPQPGGAIPSTVVINGVPQ